MGYGGVFVTVHKDYASFLESQKQIEQASKMKLKNRTTHALEMDRIDSFLIDLTDRHYRPLTFSFLAKHLLRLGEEEKRKEDRPQYT